MNINSADSTVFSSRNKTIRYADDIARRVNTLFPTVSTSRVACYNDYILHPKLKEKPFFTKITFMRKMRDALYDCAYDFTKKIDAFIGPVKIFEMGNCGEKSHLAAIIAKVNGIKDCHIACLYNCDGRDLDHEVLFVNDKKPYIIDGWLGFADYVPDALMRYQKEYNNLFDIKEDHIIGFASKCDDEYTDFFKNNFTKQQIKQIKKLHPELVL